MSSTSAATTGAPRSGAPVVASYAELLGGPPVTEVVQAGRLTRVGARPPFGTYLRQLWERRHFLWAEARAKVGSGTRETILGQVWLVAKPVLDGLTYFVVFGWLLGARAGIENFLGYLIIGVFLFSFTSQTVTNGARSIQSGRNLIRAFAFPRASLPISVVLRNLLNLVPVLGSMFALLLLLPEQERWSWRVALLPVVIALQALFVTGLTMLLARLTAKVPDVSQLISFAMRFWLYGSAVFFSTARFEEHPVILAVMHANPMFMVLDAARDCLLYGVTPSTGTWLGLTAWAVVTFVVGFLVFWKGEESYGRA